MTVSDDAQVISNVVLILISLPAFLRAWSIWYACKTIGYMSPEAVGLEWTLIIIGFGAWIIALLILAAGALIDGGIAE